MCFKTIGGVAMNLENIRERVDSINKMRARSDANMEMLFQRRDLSRLNTNPNENYTEYKNSKFFLRVGISLVLLGIVYFMSFTDFNLLTISTQKIKEVISYNIEFEDITTFWYNDSINKIVETLISTK